MIRKTLSHMDKMTQKTLILNSDPFQKSLNATHISLTLNRDVTPIVMKTYMIKTNWSTEILIMNLMIKLKTMT